MDEFLRKIYGREKWSCEVCNESNEKPYCKCCGMIKHEFRQDTKEISEMAIAAMTAAIMMKEQESAETNTLSLGETAEETVTVGCQNQPQKQNNNFTEKQGDPSIALYNQALDLLDKGSESAVSLGIYYLEKVANLGNVDAMNKLGELCYHGKGVPTNYTKAFSWYKKAAHSGDITAMYEMGNMYEMGKGVGRNTQKALEWLQKAADAGNIQAMYRLGDIYDFGFHGFSEDTEKALEWYQKAADAGDVSAMSLLGFTYDPDEGALLSVPKDKQKAQKWYSKEFELQKKAAENNSAYAMRRLGDMYGNGKGVAKDMKKALEWSKKALALNQKAAETGDTAAMQIIARIYDEGDALLNVPKDKQKALEWYIKAAEAGDVSAMSKLGSMYSENKGTPKDMQEALKWYAKAAEAGDVSAMSELGFMYSNGKDIPKDMQKALKWFQKAADSGSIDDMRYLAFTYSQCGNSQKTLEWYRKAIDAGDCDAMLELGDQYFFGLCLPQDNEKARKWLEKAQAAGNRSASNRLSNLSVKTEKEKKGACFITTAVCDSFGKPDDCYELTIFRQFRDTWLRKQSDGESLIKEYYFVAPRIVSNINLLDNAKEVYRSIWTDYLKPCLLDLESDDKVSCKKRYVRMVMDLKEKYLK